MGVLGNSRKKNREIPVIPEPEESPRGMLKKRPKRNPRKTTLKVLKMTFSQDELLKKILERTRVQIPKESSGEIPEIDP